LSRIRSIHPGLFTDDSFMEASAYSRLLIIGIWTEAWDDAVFQWRPTTLKARIFPGDSVDIVPLLEELERLNFVKSIEIEGKKYGVIRNFRKYQRPKKPNSSGLLPAELREYAFLTNEEFSQSKKISCASSEPVRNHDGTSTENQKQMEEGGKEVVTSYDISNEISPEADPQAAPAKSEFQEPKPLNPPTAQAEPIQPDAELFRRGKGVLGKSAGGMIRNLVEAKGGSIALARAVIEQASTKENPREYVAAAIKTGAGPPIESYRDDRGDILAFEAMSTGQLRAYQAARDRGDIG
jgi:hypothetical protein